MYKSFHLIFIFEKLILFVIEITVDNSIIIHMKTIYIYIFFYDTN